MTQLTLHAKGVFIIYGWGAMVGVLYSTPFDFCMASLKGSNKLNGPPKSDEQNFDDSPRLLTTAQLQFILHYYKRDN